MSMNLKKTLETPTGAPENSLAVAIHWQKQPAQPSPFLPEPLLEQFVTLGAWGGFAGTKQRPGGASASALERRIGPHSGHFTIAMREAEPGAALVLEKILTFSHTLISPLEWISIQCGFFSSGGQPSPVVGRYPLIPFACSTALDSDEVQVRIEFAREPDATQAAKVVSVMMAWSFVAAAGGYEADLDDVVSPFMILTDEPEWVNHELIMRLDDVAFDESAIDSLINALVGIHENSFPIICVEIE